jgi:hypothetical protein
MSGAISGRPDEAPSAKAAAANGSEISRDSAKESLFLFKKKIVNL